MHRHRVEPVSMEAGVESVRSQHSKDRRRQEALALSPRGTSPALGTFGLQDGGGQTSLVSSHQVGGGLLEETNALPFSGLCSPSRRAVVMFYFSRTRASPAPPSGSAAPGPPGCPPQCAGRWDRPAHAPDGPGAARSKAGPGQRLPPAWRGQLNPGPPGPEPPCRSRTLGGLTLSRPLQAALGDGFPPLCLSLCPFAHFSSDLSKACLHQARSWLWLGVGHDFFIFELPWLGPMA